MGNKVIVLYMPLKIHVANKILEECNQKTRKPRLGGKGMGMEEQT